MKAVWKGVTLAESDQTIVVENNHYFPPGSVKMEYLKESKTHTTCPWKGIASYYDLQVNGEKNPDAAWFYPNPSEAAHKIKDFIAFWKGVKIVE